MHLLITPLLLLLPRLAAAVGTCYFPDGSIAANDIPCDDSGATVGCCGANDRCYDTGLCSNTATDTSIARGSCTDASWGSGCPLACRGNKSGGEMIRLCSLDRYCCGDECCQKETFEVYWQPGLAGYNQTVETATTTVTVAATATATGTGDVSVAAVSASEVAAEAEAAQTCTTRPTTARKSDSAVAAVGGVLGVALAAALGALVWMQLRHRRMLAEVQAGPSRQGPGNLPLPMEHYAIKGGRGTARIEELPA
ncbi:hypothetical protein EDC01DRAFT_661046 [Geopyxis carbonaria]|nr:hypothetical protein EDC01DRAFT_661046 [Geopyxis carbonaria]